MAGVGHIAPIVRVAMSFARYSGYVRFRNLSIADRRMTKSAQPPLGLKQGEAENGTSLPEQ
jgi:hypothetical protein